MLEAIQDVLRPEMDLGRKLTLARPRQQ